MPRPKPLTIETGRYTSRTFVARANYAGRNWWTFGPTEEEARARMVELVSREAGR